MATPLFRAHGHRWATSPFRFTNGFNSAESLYTPAAVFNSPTAAHWLHTAMFALFALGTAALARKWHVSGSFAAAGVIAIPAAAGQSWLAYNDVFTAALLVCAVVAVVWATKDRDLWVAGLLVAGAISVNPLLVVLAPLVALLVVAAERRKNEKLRLARAVVLSARVVVPAVVVSVLWMLYTRHFAGVWFQQLPNAWHPYSDHESIPPT